MSQLVWYAVAACAAVASLLALWLVTTGINDAANWLDRRSHERAQRLEREMAKTKEVLALVSQAQATMLDARAHEAAVAMILESYRASHDVAAEITSTSDGQAGR